MGGHVQQGVIKRALTRMPTEWHGRFEKGKNFWSTHLQFVNEIYITILFPTGDPQKNIPDKDVTELLNMHSEIADLSTSIRLIDVILTCT